MHAHRHTEMHTRIHVTSSLLARAACWVTVNAFCAFLTHFLCKDEVEISVLLRSVFFKQKEELHCKDREMHSYHLRHMIFPVVYKDDVIYIHDSAESAGRVILSPCWVFSMNPMSPFCASTDCFSLRHYMWMMTSDRSASPLHWIVHFSLSLDWPSLRTFDLIYFRSLLTLGRRAKGEIMP